MKQKIVKFFKKKRNIWIIVILILLAGGGYFVFGRNGGPASFQTGKVSRQNLEETVLATGQVVSETDLNLSFQSGGVVTKIYVKEGDQVKTGQTLAVLDQAVAMAELTRTRGALLQAQANYDKVLAGATSEDIKVYQDAVDSAIQDLTAAYSSALNELDEAYIKAYNALTVAQGIESTYFSLADQQGISFKEARLKMVSATDEIKRDLSNAMLSSSRAVIDSSVSSVLANLNKIGASLEIMRSVADVGVYYSKVTSADKTSLDTQKTNINSVLGSLTDAQQAIASYKIALQKAESQLAFKKAPPTKAEVDAAQAQVISAQGQVDAAKATLGNLILSAPAAGTITRVGIKVGEQATALAEVIDLQNVGDLYAEAYISEANIASLAIGQPVDYTFDALGPDQHFEGSILTINPASTVISGVVNYKVKGNIDNISSVKPGMTANMTILVAKKESVLAVPSTAVINKNGKKIVRVVENLKEKTFREAEVQTGLQADGGVVEIVSGLSEGQEIVIYMK